jgi:single-strand DNA-binding protein
MNAVSFVGNLTANPKLIEGSTGTRRATFSIAVNEGQGDDEKTHFLNVTAFGTLGENVASSLSKGQRVVVVGRLNTYPKEVEIDGVAKNLTMVAVTASAVGPDLKWAVAKVTKITREAAPAEEVGNDGEEEAAADSSKSSASSKAAKPAPAAKADDEGDDF